MHHMSGRFPCQHMCSRKFKGQRTNEKEIIIGYLEPFAQCLHLIFKQVHDLVLSLMPVWDQDILQCLRCNLNVDHILKMHPRMLELAEKFNQLMKNVINECTWSILINHSIAASSKFLSVRVLDALLVEQELQLENDC